MLHKLTTLTVLLLLTISTFAKQKETEKVRYQPRVVLSYYPFDFVASNMKLGIEWKLDSRFAIKTTVRAGLADKSKFYSMAGTNFFNTSTRRYYDAENYSGAGLEAQFRYYLNEKAPNGFYCGILANYKTVQFEQRYTESQYVQTFYTNYNNISYGMDKVNIQAGGFGFIGGVQAFIADRVSVDMYIGTSLVKAGYPASKLADRTRTLDRLSTGVGLLFGFNLGFGIK